MCVKQRSTPCVCLHVALEHSPVTPVFERMSTHPHTYGPTPTARHTHTHTHAPHLRARAHTHARTLEAPNRRCNSSLSSASRLFGQQASVRPIGARRGKTPFHDACCPNHCSLRPNNAAAAAHQHLHPPGNGCPAALPLELPMIPRIPRGRGRGLEGLAFAAQASRPKLSACIGPEIGGNASRPPPPAFPGVIWCGASPKVCSVARFGSKVGGYSSLS